MSLVLARLPLHYYHKKAPTRYNRPSPPPFCHHNLTTINTLAITAEPKNNEEIQESQGPIAVISPSSVPHWHCHHIKKKGMNLVVLGTFFASFVPFVFLYMLLQNSKKKKKRINRDEAVLRMQNDNSTVSGHKIGGYSGNDVIIVGAGVAGAALAYTLGKVTIINPFFF